MKPPISPDPDMANCDCFEENMLDSMGVYDEDDGKIISAEQQQRFSAFKYTSPLHLPPQALSSITSTDGKETATLDESAPSKGGLDTSVASPLVPEKRNHGQKSTVPAVPATGTVASSASAKKEGRSLAVGEFTGTTNDSPTCVINLCGNFAGPEYRPKVRPSDHCVDDTLCVNSVSVQSPATPKEVFEYAAAC